MITRVRHENPERPQNYYLALTSFDGKTWVPLTARPDPSADEAMKRCMDHTATQLLILHQRFDDGMTIIQTNQAHLPEPPGAEDRIYIAGVRQPLNDDGSLNWPPVAHDGANEVASDDGLAIAIPKWPTPTDSEIQLHHGHCIAVDVFGLVAIAESLPALAAELQLQELTNSVVVYDLSTRHGTRAPDITDSEGPSFEESLYRELIIALTREQRRRSGPPSRALIEVLIGALNSLADKDSLPSHNPDDSIFWEDCNDVIAELQTRQDAALFATVLEAFRGYLDHFASAAGSIHSNGIVAAPIDDEASPSNSG